MSPTAPHIIDRLGAIIADYDAILCDVWGVIHDGRRAFPRACAALVEAGRSTPVVLISNSPRPSGDVAAQLRMLGVPDAAWSGFVTSGDATRDALVTRAPGPVWTIGPVRDGVLYEGLGLQFADAAGAAFVCCTGLVDDERESPDDYQGALTEAAQRGLEMICANPDRVVQRGSAQVWCAGALADLYVTLGGRVVMAGKPAAPIYDLAVAEAERLVCRPLRRSRVLCIGDGVATDVAGANAQALDLLYVADGVNAAEALADGALDPVRLSAFLAQTGGHARYAIRALA